LLALSGTFDQITTSVIFAVWLFTALVGSSLFVLRRKLPAAPRRYRAIGYPVVPAIFVLVAAWLVINSLSATPVESAAGLLLIAIGLPFFLFFRATRRDVHAEEEAGTPS
jgi:APA family basic amino acid/polyamine antiporter